MAYSTEKKLKLTPNYAPITDNYLTIIFQSVFLTKKKYSVYKLCLFKLWKLIAIQYLQSALRQMTHHD